MDGYRDHPSEFDLPAVQTAPASDVSDAIGTDERRMHVRAYNYWVSLLGGRDYPSIEDLEPGDVEDFAANSVLLDFTSGGDDPATPYIGSAVRDECDLDNEIRTIADVPSRSLLSRLTDHYLQIIANRAPIGFEAEFVNQRGAPICYRGILMPFSSDGDTIDFIYGVINWKRSEGVAGQQPIAAMLPPPEDEPLELTNALAEAEAEASAGDALDPADDGDAADDGVTPLQEPDAAGDFPPPGLDPDAGLADRLWAARETAEAVKSADHRSRAALYRALALAYDFAVAATGDPDGYAELLEESGVKAQARAPMTPVVKLVFGIDYDKTRLTEFAAALSCAKRQAVSAGGFLAFVEGNAGGLKALVVAERQARRPARDPNTKADAARARLRAAAPLQLREMVADGEFTLVVTRRSADGGLEAVAVVNDEALLERAIRRSGA